MKKSKKILAAKILSLSILTSMSYGQFGIVFDPTNLQANLMDWSTNFMTTIESVAQTAKQIEEYKTQLEQLETQIKNLVSVPQEIYDNVNSTIQSLNSAMKTMEGYKQKFGNLEGLLEEYKASYKDHICFKSTSSCSQSEKQQLLQQEQKVIDYQKSMNDDLFKGIENQMNQITKDGQKLDRIQQQAQGAEGNLEALQSANQLSASTNQQLLQLRQMINQKMLSEGAKRQEEIDQQAKDRAADEQMRNTKSFSKSSGKTYGW